LENTLFREERKIDILIVENNLTFSSSYTPPPPLPRGCSRAVGLVSEIKIHERKKRAKEENK
jgi:hypothetical protein